MSKINGIKGIASLCSMLLPILCLTAQMEGQQEIEPFSGLTAFTAQEEGISAKTSEIEGTASSLQKKEHKTVCLSMIVKNEHHVITRCLATVKPLIDYWVIVDTGSTDGTQDIIKEYMKGIPGELHEHPWVNFAHNRNQALNYAKGDYVLIIDADEMLEYPPDFKLPPLTADAYLFTLLRGNNEYSLPTLCRTDKKYEWRGVLHEYLSSPEAKDVGHIQGIVRTTKSDGARSRDPQKYQKDAEILEKALVEEPHNERYMFYLAQSYRDCGQREKSLEAYKKRVAMKGWDQEVFFSLWQIARLQEMLNKSHEEIVKGYTAAFVYRPTRVEPLNDLTKYYLKNQEYEKAYRIATIGKEIKQPPDILFVEKTAYDFDMLLQYSVAAYWVGKIDEAKKISEELLKKKDLPDNVRQVIERNLAFSNAKLIEELTGEEM